MASSGPGQSDREKSYYTMAGDKNNGSSLLSSYYNEDLADMPGPATVIVKDGDGTDVEHKAKARKGRPSIFNRYSIFYFNSIVGHGESPEPYMDMPNRLADLASGGAKGFQSVIDNPSAKNIINWSKQGGADGGTNAVEYAWEDFLWCKNYGHIPNNYMVTMRRFSIPVSDDLLDKKKQPSPDVGRLITWVDGTANTWEAVGLKFDTSLTWTKLESEIQSLSATAPAGNEGGALPGGLGNIVKQFSALTQPGQSDAVRSYNPETANIDPYATKNITFGPIDVIKEMMVREKGLNFTQDITLNFEYELRSIDGINPKIAMIDLLSNVLVVTANRGEFWGGEIRHYGGDPRRIKPLGDTKKLASGDMGGYFASLVSGISGRLNNLTGGAGLSMEGIGNAMKNIGGGLMNNIIGGGLDKMGRPGAQAMQALLSGEDTGEWHVMIGNPANPIMSIGNLYLEKTEISLHGALGPDDFPTKLKVTCSLKPSRPRDRSDIMALFHRNARTYLTTPPSAKRYAGNLKKAGQNGGKIPKGDKDASINDSKLEAYQGIDASNRFPNHASGGSEDINNDFVIDMTAQGIF